MTARARLIASVCFSAVAVILGVLAAWPIYRTWWVLVPALAGLVIGVGVAAIGVKRWSVFTSLLVLFGAFVLTVVPVAVPQSFERLPLGVLQGLVDGIAAIALGWKQLLTLTLPVGTYQTVLVPAYIIFLLIAFLTTTLAMRAGRFAPLAAFPLTFGVAFGTVFGASAVSSPAQFGPFTVSAPRELALWLAAAALGAVWVWFTAGAERRAALRRGRQLRADGDDAALGVAGVAGVGGVGGVAGEGVDSATVRQGTARRLTRVALGAGTLLLAFLIALSLLPGFDAAARQVPRDRIDPAIVLQQQPSPLAAYRTSKQDEALDTPLFTVTSDGALPGRLRLAVLDHYNGVDFIVGTNESGRFTRFPSAPRVADPARVNISIGEGYQNVWVPIAPLGSVPTFSGPRATELADSFFFNRGAEAAIVVPADSVGTGLQSDDGVRAIMSTAPAPQLTADPASKSTFDVEAMPELEAWLEIQDQPATAEGYIELVKRLRERGYLSHSISNSEGQQLWIERLSAQYGTRFESSPGGHSVARVEQLFAELNTQQRLAGENASPETLVAAIGDDEQFATAAALLARALGFDSRVVIGVRLVGEGGAATAANDVPGVPACERVCTGANLAAWVEVRGADGSWATIDVTPQVEIRPTALEAGEQLPEFATIPEDRDASEVEPPLGFGERSDGTENTAEQAAASWIWPLLRGIGLALAALVLLMLPLLFLPFAKRRREQQRRMAGDPEVRALGAWQTMLDNATDAGVVLPARAGRAEIAQQLGTAPALWAAATADRAVFSANSVTDADAEWMWAAADADFADRQAGLTRWGRIRAKYSLRSYGVRVASRRSSAQESTETAEPAASPEGVR